MPRCEWADCRQDAKWMGFWYERGAAINGIACDAHLIDLMPRDRTINLIGLMHVTDRYRALERQRLLRR